MSTALNTSASGMEASQTALNVTSNNLANVSTTGYKKVRPQFQEILSQLIGPAAGSQVAQGTFRPAEEAQGLGVQLSATERIFRQGSLTVTNNPLDLAIEGDGFFQVIRPDGTIGYTRDGSFTKDANGQVVTAQGYQLSPGITIPQNATSITVGNDGSVSVTIPGATTPQNVGQITLASFINSAGLSDAGQNILTETSASGPPLINTPGTNGAGIVQDGSLESSNVEAVEEIVDMITEQRQFDFCSRGITAWDNEANTATALFR